MNRRIGIFHGVNLGALGSRPAEHYGELTYTQLEQRIAGYSKAVGLMPQFFQTNFEGAYVEQLHKAPDQVDGLVLNPGAWTHYSWAIRDALEICALPAVEVHLSDVQRREPWRKLSVISELCIATFSGQGVDGYRVALERLRDELLGGS